MKLRIGVVMGGKSIEREVSFNSGRTICDHLDTQVYDVIPFFQSLDGQLYVLPTRFLHRGKISDFEHRLSDEATAISWDQIKQCVDFMYLALHGRHGEDGEIQGMLELLQIPYLGSKVYASAIGMNKALQKTMLEAHGITVPRGVTIPLSLIRTLPESLSAIQKLIQTQGLPYPLIAKPGNEGSSLGVCVIKDETHLFDALLTSGFVNANIAQEVLLEEKITGLEFSCIILTHPTNGEPMPLPVSEIITEQGSDLFDYQQKYMPGRAHKLTPARVSSERMQQIHDMCVRVMQALDMCNLARIDGFVKPDGTIVIIDPNTLSGMGPSQFIFRQAAELNISHTELINHLIKTELKLYGIDVSLHEEKLMDKAVQKKRIGVILGGRSNEREISLESGRNVCYKLSPDKYEIIPLFLSADLELYRIDQRLLVRNTTKEITAGLDPAMQLAWADLANCIDFAFIALHGGEGENGVLQGALQVLGIPYNGSGIFASSLCMDKYRTNILLKQCGFDVPHNVLATKEAFTSDQAAVLHQIDQLGYPVIVKPHDDGCSVFVSKAANSLQVQEALTQIFKEKAVALVEEYVTGMELTVGVLGNDEPVALPPSHTVSVGDILSIEEKFLPGAGENQTPAPITADATLFVQRTIEQVYKAAQCSGYARIDCFYQSPEQSPTGTHRLIVLEINSLPALTPATCIFHQAAEIGMRPMEFIDKIVAFGIEAHNLRTVPMQRPQAIRYEQLEHLSPL